MLKAIAMISGVLLLLVGSHLLLYLSAHWAFGMPAETARTVLL